MTSRGWWRIIRDRWQRIARSTLIEWGVMTAVVALSAALNLWNLGASGYGNLYYAAAVRSMSQSWRNLFFVAYDPGGFVSVDKPPLGFWAQVLSVKLLGFSGFALLLPEALAGVIAVAVLWRVVRRSFGAPAGVVAALALAVSPVNVVTNRDNVLEPLLTLTLLLAAWAVSVATERGALRWLLVGAVLIGIGFNVKMLEAYLIVPALALLYLVGARARLRTRLLHLTLAGVVMIAFSFAWITAVDLTPASQRPYVGSTSTNSELDLALGYNGIGRLFGGFTFPEPHPGGSRIHGAQPRATLSRLPRLTPATAQPIGRQAHSHPQPTPPEPTGAPGPLRLFQAALGSQVSWLLPLAIAGFALLAGLSLWPFAEAPAAPAERTLGLHWERWRRTKRTHGLLLWGMWLLTAGACFSIASGINAYYVAVLAPAICALAGAGATELWRAYCRPFLARRAQGAHGADWLGLLLALLLPVALLATFAEQATLLGAAPHWRPGLASKLLALSVILALALAVLRAGESLRRARWRADAHALWRSHRRAGLLAGALAGLSLAGLIIAPTSWTLSSLTWGNAGGWPTAGPEFASPAPLKHPLVDAATVRYLLAHRGDDHFIVGALNSYLTAPLIVATGQPVMDMGGFNGSDPILTTSALAQLVAQDKVHLFLLPSSNVTQAQRVMLFGAPKPATSRGAARLRAFSSAANASITNKSGGAYTDSLTRWVSLHCSPVPPSQWSSAEYAKYRLGAWEMFSCQP